MVLNPLAERDPREYEGWTFQDLRETLAEGEVSVRKSHEVMSVHADDLAQALAQRDREEGTEDDHYPNCDCLGRTPPRFPYPQMIKG